MKLVAINFALLLVLGSAAPAQTLLILNTGCPTEGYPQATGTPRLGQQFGTRFVPRGRPILAFAAIGAEVNPAPLAAVLTCGAVCPMAVDRPFLILGASWSLVVPNSPSLVGVCFAVQHGTVAAVGNAACVRVSGALRVCLRR